MIQEEYLLELADRFVTAVEKIATALEGLNDQAQRAGRRFNWAARSGKPAEPIITHVPTEEDKAREEQGLNDTRPISRWLSGIDDEEQDQPFVGQREREWLARNAQGGTGSKTSGQAG